MARWAYVSDETLRLNIYQCAINTMSDISWNRHYMSYTEKNAAYDAILHMLCEIDESLAHDEKELMGGNTDDTV